MGKLKEIWLKNLENQEIDFEDSEYDQMFSYSASKKDKLTMSKEEFVSRITQIVSEMLDTPYKYGIYPTTKTFAALDALYDELAHSKDKSKS